MAIGIEFDPPTEKQPKDFDFLGKQSAECLQELFPGSKVQLKYVKEMEVPDMPGIRRVVHKAPLIPGLLRRSFKPVPNSPHWFREITLLLREESQRFLGFGPGSVDIPGWSQPHDRGDTKIRLRVPRELEHAAWICEYIAQLWSPHTQNFKADMRNALLAAFPGRVICHIVADLFYPLSGKGLHENMANVLEKTIQNLDALAASRVEHQLLSHGVVIAQPPKKARNPKLGLYPEDFTLKRTSLLADGVRAALWISPAGEPVGWLTRESQRMIGRTRSTTLPFGAFGFAADISHALRGLAIVLRQDGSMILFARGRPVFMRRGGKWRGLLWNSVRNVMGQRYKQIGKIVFDAALILSFTGHGGILGIVNNLPDGVVNEKDRVDVARQSFSRARSSQLKFQKEWLFHILLPTDRVRSLGASTLAMLAGIDGATIIDSTGKLLAYGAVVQSQPSESEGARSAAARALSRWGFVVKVSADGPLTLYENKEQILEI